MGKTAGRILKGNTVKLEGQFHLDLAQVETNSQKAQGVASAAPHVRIVENRTEFAVMEITCSCGTRTYLKCEYGGAEASTKGSAPDQVPDQTK